MQKFRLVSDVPFDFEGHCFISIDETEYWFIKGKVCHRLDGPSIISKRPIPRSYYFLNDTEYSEREYWGHPKVIEYKLDKILKL